MLNHWLCVWTGLWAQSKTRDATIIKVVPETEAIGTNVISHLFSFMYSLTLYSLYNLLSGLVTLLIRTWYKIEISNVTKTAKYILLMVPCGYSWLKHLRRHLTLLASEWQHETSVIGDKRERNSNLWWYDENARPWPGAGWPITEENCKSN